MCEPVSITAMLATMGSAIGSMGTALAGVAGLGGAAGAAAGAAGTAATAASAAGSLGTVLQTASAIGGGLSAFQSAMFQSQVAKQNAAEAMREAQSAQKAGDQAVQTSQQKTAALLGAQTAQMAASGLDLSSGSPADVQGDTMRAGAQDAATIRQNYYDRVRGYVTDANNFSTEAAAAKAKGYGDLAQGILKGGSSLLGGASSLSAKWSSFQRLGLPVPKGAG